jgi:hypothetical protein
MLPYYVFTNKHGHKKTIFNPLPLTVLVALENGWTVEYVYG